MNRLWVTMLLSLTACGALTPPGKGDAGIDAGQADAGQPADDGGLTDAGFTGTIEVTPLFTGRSRLGARSIAGFRPWRGGLAVVGDWLYWVETGTAPGLYRAPTAGCAGSCVEKVATLVRPSAFTSTGASVVVADVATLTRYFPDGGTQPVANASAEVMNLTTDGTAAFWTTESSPVVKTPFGGASSTIINSNGTPVAITVAGTRVYWAGVDISGLLGALQSIGTNGTGAREESRFGSGFETLGGNGTYLYYAKDSPAQVLRLTLSSGMLEVAATNCQGVRDFAIDATHAYWVEPGSAPDFANGRVRRVSHESTTPEQLAQSVARPVGIALWGQVVFVAAAGTPAASYADGAILRITLPP